MIAHDKRASYLQTYFTDIIRKRVTKFRLVRHVGEIIN